MQSGVKYIFSMTVKQLTNWGQQWLLLFQSRSTLKRFLLCSFPLILIDTPGWGINFPIDFQSFDKIVNGTKTLKTLNKILWLNQKPISEDEYSLVFMRQLVAKYGRNIWQGVTLLNSNSSDSTLCQTLILEVRQYFNIFNQINCYGIDETNRILADIIVSKRESFDFVDYDKAMEDSR